MLSASIKITSALPLTNAVNGLNGWLISMRTPCRSSHCSRLPESTIHCHSGSLGMASRMTAESCAADAAGACSPLPESAPPPHATAIKTSAADHPNAFALIRWTVICRTLAA